jgi:hypothetical protein
MSVSGTYTPEALIAMQESLRHTGNSNWRPIAYTPSLLKTQDTGRFELYSPAALDPMKVTKS